MEDVVLQLWEPLDRIINIDYHILEIVSPEGVKSYLLISSSKSKLLSDVGCKLEECNYGQDWQEDEEPAKWSKYSSQGGHLWELPGVSGEYVPRDIVPRNISELIMNFV